MIQTRTNASSIQRSAALDNASILSATTDVCVLTATCSLQITTAWVCIARIRVHFLWLSVTITTSGATWLCLRSRLSLSVCLWWSKCWKSSPSKFRYIVRIFGFSSYTKVIGSRSRSSEQKACLCILFACGLPSTERRSCLIVINYLSFCVPQLFGVNIKTRSNGTIAIAMAVDNNLISKQVSK